MGVGVVVWIWSLGFRVRGLEVEGSSGFVIFGGLGFRV
jgi:hypothetical protein